MSDQALPAIASETRPGRAARVRGHLGRQWHIWLVIVLTGVLAAPRLGYLLPAIVDHTDEIYQPLQALKFAATKGQAFHKHGPVPNFVLLPAYAATFAWWKLTGEFGSPQADYPYGLARPIEQMGVLIFEARLIFLLLGLAALAAVTAATHRLTKDRVATAGAAALMVATCYRFQWALPTPSVDASMIAFLLLAMAAWLWMAADGPTPRLGAAFGADAALAVGSKENSAIPLLAMALALAVWCAFSKQTAEVGNENPRWRLWRSMLTAAVVGAGLYLATSVVYAPGVWWQRMQYWSGPGVSGDVWGENASWSFHLRFVGGAMLNNLGPAGVIVAPLAILAAYVRRPGLSALLSVPPLASIAGALALPYSTDRFLTPAVVTMLPIVALGLTGRSQSRLGRGRPAFVPAMIVVATAVNLLWTSVVYHLDDLTDPALIERDLPGEPDGRRIGYGRMSDDDPTMRRVAYLGYRVDPRAMQKWAADGDPPDVVYINAGRAQMLEEARRMPGRAAFYASEYDFDLAAWPGFEALGYGPPHRVVVSWPTRLAWFEWMPLVRELRHNQMLVYERPPVGQ